MDARITGKRAQSGSDQSGPAQLARTQRDNGASTIQLLTGSALIPQGETWRQLIVQIATLQCGCISHRQCRMAGATDHQIEGMLNRGELTPRHRGVYVLGHTAAVDLQREAAALLAAGAQMTLTGLSVLSAMGLTATDHHRPVDLGCYGERRAPRSRAGISVHRYRGLAPHHVRIRRGLAMTTVERALLDAAPELADRDLERAVDEALGGRATSRTKLTETAQADPNHAGASRIAVLADPQRRTSRTESTPAEQMLALIRAAGLPEPETEVSLYGFRADFFFRDARLVLEVDSFGWHTLVRRNNRRDHRKDRVLRANGLEVLRVDADDITEHPLAVIADLTRTITERMNAQRPG